MNSLTAIVTGASRGIGREIAITLANSGYNVVVNYNGSENDAQETRKICEESGIKAMTFRADVSKYDQVQAMFDTAQGEFGTIDLLVNNAGITKDNLIVRMSEEDFDQVMDINLKGAFLCSKIAAKIMSKQRSGKIINISSVVGVTGNAGQTNYSASKAGLIGFTKSLAKELAKRNICVNAIAPGFIETDMTNVLTDSIKEKLGESIPLGRMGKTKDISDTVLFLSNANYITGQVIIVDGGMTI